MAEKLDFVSPESPDVIFENYLDHSEEGSIESIAEAAQWFAISDNIECHEHRETLYEDEMVAAAVAPASLVKAQNIDSLTAENSM